MSAKLIVQSAESDAEHWIEMPVLRVGKMPDCDIVIKDNGVADHALTLEFRDGQYVVHNRSEAAFEIGRRAVSPGTSLPFKDGQSLRINGDIQLSLAIEGDPRPTPAPSNTSNQITSAHFQASDIDQFDDGLQIEDELDESDRTNSTSSTTDAKTLFQIVIILVCFAGITGTLILKSGLIELKTDEPVKELLEIIQAADSTWKQQVVKQLQIAESARLRGQYDEAGVCYARLRDELQSHADEVNTDGFNVDVQRFLMQRLTSLPAN